MTILVISDSHGKTVSVKNLLDKYTRTANLVIHLGDHADDILRYTSDFSHLTIAAVSGNVDGYRAPIERIITLNERKILLTHGHVQDVKSGLDRLIFYAIERQVDVCLFGHTHEPVSFVHDGIFFMNPGSLGAPRPGGRAGYGLITLGSAVEGRLLPL